MISNTKISPMLATRDVVRLLNVHVNTVRWWSNQGILKAYRVNSRGDRRFEQKEVTRLLTKQDDLPQVIVLLSKLELLEKYCSFFQLISHASRLGVIIGGPFLGVNKL